MTKKSVAYLHKCGITPWGFCVQHHGIPRHHVSTFRLQSLLHFPPSDEFPSLDVLLNDLGVGVKQIANVRSHLLSKHWVKDQRVLWSDKYRMGIAGVACTSCNTILAVIEIKGVKQIVNIFDLRQLGNFENTSVEANKWETRIEVSSSKRTTVVLHWKCPVAPYRAHCLDIIGNVEEGMDGQGTSRKAFRAMSLIEPEEKH